MQKIKEFLQGKKTYLSAVLIALVACVGWWIHVVGYTEALSLLGVAGGMAGLGAKNERYGAAVLALLDDIQHAQAKVPPGQKIDTKQFAEDLSKQIMSQFATGGLVRSTPAGAVSNVVTFGNDPALSRCIFCGLPVVNGGGNVCTDPRNTSTPDTVGNKHHVFVVPIPRRKRFRERSEVTLLPKELALKLPGWLLSGGMGAGAAIAYVLADREPKALIETFQHWGPWSLLGLVGMVIASRVGERVMDMGERAIQAVAQSASSQQQLADAVNTIARKDDERAREMELVVDHLARNSRRALDDLREIKEQLASPGGKERASAHTAGG